MGYFIGRQTRRARRHAKDRQVLGEVLKTQQTAKERQQRGQTLETERTLKDDNSGPHDPQDIEVQSSPFKAQVSIKDSDNMPSMDMKEGTSPYKPNKW